MPRQRYVCGFSAKPLPSLCGDRGPGKHHLSMNTDMDVFRCNLCAASGNSVTLYARLKGVSNKEAYRDLTGRSGIYPFLFIRSF